MDHRLKLARPGTVGSSKAPSNFIAGRPKAASLFWLVVYRVEVLGQKCGARLIPGALGQNILGLVSPPPSPPKIEWGLWDKNTRGFLVQK